MQRSRCTDEQIVHALRQVEAGMPAVELSRKLGVTELTFHRWAIRSPVVCDKVTSSVPQDHQMYPLSTAGGRQSRGIGGH